MFVIQHSSKLYFHNKGKIILFETLEEASNFLNMFIQYSTNRFAQGGNIGAIMQVHMIVTNECEIKPVEFDIENVECGVIWIKELFDNVR